MSGITSSPARSCLEDAADQLLTAIYPLLCGEEERLEAAERRITEWCARAEQAERELERVREALRPFAIFGANNVNEEGWKDGCPGRDRIVDRFGPSKFRAAKEALDSAPSLSGGCVVMTLAEADKLVEWFVSRTEVTEETAHEFAERWGALNVKAALGATCEHCGEPQKIIGYELAVPIDDRSRHEAEDLCAFLRDLASRLSPENSSGVEGDPEELTARQQVDAALHQAGIASAPERLSTGPSLNAEERAWLDGRDDTIGHIRDELADLPDSLSHRSPVSPQPNPTTPQPQDEEGR